MANHPVDQGWAWVICFASFLCVLCVGTTIQTLAVLFLELVEEFDTTLTTTSLAMMMLVLFSSVSAVLSTNVTVPRFDERRVVVVAGAIMSLLASMYYVAPNIAVFICLAAGQGICLGFIYIPSISLTTKYFDKWRSIAATISNSGLSVSMIAGPPFIRAVVSAYGLRGTLLIMSGIQMHLVVAGMLLRPLQAYGTSTRPILVVKVESALPTDETKTSLLQRNEDREKEVAKEHLYEKANSSNEDGKTEDATTEVTEMFKRQNGNHSTQEHEVITEQLHSQSLKEHYTSPLYDDIDQEELRLQRHRKLSAGMIVARVESSRPPNFRLLQKSISHEVETKGSGPIDLAHTKVGSVWSVTSGAESLVAGISFGKNDEDEQSEEEEDGTSEGKSWRTWCCCVILRKIFDPEVLRPWAFRSLLITAFPATTTQYLLQYIPTIGVKLGATKEEGALLLVITGAVDLGSRLVIGLFADTKLLRPSQIIAIGQFFLGILCHCSGLFTDFGGLVAWAVIMGLFIGTRVSLLPVLLIEVAGLHRMARCFSIFAMVATIFASIHSPMMSSLYEATGTFTSVLHFVGACQLFSAFSLLFVPWLCRLDQSREEKQKQMEKDGLKS